MLWPTWNRLAPRRAGFVLGLITAIWGACADEKLPRLKVGDEVYTNVIVTSVTAADVYFNHAGGMGNAKLKDLEPALQKHFGFDRKKAGQIEQQKREGSWAYRLALASAKPAKPAAAEGQRTDVIYDDGDLVVTNLAARSFRGQRPPQIVVADWLTPPPDVTGKFVLVEFWTTWSEACRDVIPHLNQLHARFKDRVVVLGVSDESLDDLRKMSWPHMDYAVGSDPQAQTMRALEVRAIPHAILIDPKDIVRFEGVPVYLDNDTLEHLIRKYSE
jgi:cytochrome c biogenesis protein CcmG, thiol:disulfide interchange protein DsbE